MKREKDVFTTEGGTLMIDRALFSTGQLNSVLTRDVSTHVISHKVLQVSLKVHEKSSQQDFSSHDPVLDV